MSLSTGTRLGPYEIVSPLGAGGMGEVYRARDTRLDRTVAIKVLPTTLAADPEFRDRFEREARAISQLNHPHICALYDVGRDRDTDYLVLEFLEGETLAARLAKGPLPFDEALAIGIQMCDALARAHRAGIIHRDLKPGNIMVTKAGAKLLDFGLAKSSAASPVSGMTALPTMPAALTAQGTILGTFQYMAPEQLEGREATAQSDIWAFGCLLYEMLTGRRAFEGSSHATLITSIMSAQPPPIAAAHPTMPAALDRLVGACLKKDPEARWQSASDLSRELQWIRDAPTTLTVTPATARRSSALLLAGGALALCVLAALPFVYRHLVERPAEGPVLRFTIAPPAGTALALTEYGILGGANSLQISPDGRQLAFIGESGVTRALWLRPLDRVDATVAPGTDGARMPFWSPDSRAIAFFASGKLKKLDLASGAIDVLADARYPEGGSWGKDGTILFTPAAGPLYRIHGTGGAPTQVAPLDAARHEYTQRWPYFLPDGRRFIYLSTISTSQTGNAIYAGSLDSKQRTKLLDVDSRAIYSPPGFLLYERGGELLAHRFDADRLTLLGEPIQVAASVDTNRVWRSTTVSASDTGVLVYRAAVPGQQELLWMDRTGRRLGSVGAPDTYALPALSPDETRLAIQRSHEGHGELWVINLARGDRSRITRLGRAGAAFPAWSPDGQSIMFMSNPQGPENIYRTLASGTGEPTLIFGSEMSHKHVQQWSRDGRYVLFDSVNDIWALPLFGDRPSTGSGRPELAEGRTPIRVVGTDAAEGQPRLSPDGRWLAYTSDETGRSEAYVQPFPATGEKWPISTAGGGQPRWRGDGKELFYLAPDRRLMSVAIDVDTTFHPGVPQPLFETPLIHVTTSSELWFPDGFYVNTADGQRFLFIAPIEAARTVPATVITNWTAIAKDGPEKQ